MRTADEIDVVLLIEGGDYLLAESERNTTVILAPALNILVGV
jgi:hypothetical protein